MKKFLPLFLTLAVCLWAADFWQAKPYTDWSDKEVQRVETNSPWAKQVSVGLGGASPGGGSGKGHRGGSESDPSGGAGGRGTADVGGGNFGGEPSIMLTVSWRTALPVRQAVAKEKFGAEAATSPEAKKLIDEDQKVYAILVSGLPGRSIRNGDKMKEMLLKNTTLTVKGKDAIACTDVQSGGNEQKSLVLFIFPKTNPLSAGDKEVEFSTQLGPITVKQRFHLKDMVFNGKLEL